MKRSFIIEFISILLMVLFLYTGVSKLMEYTVFKEQLSESPVLAPVAPIITWLLPVTEMLVCMLLLIPQCRLVGLYVSLSLMIGFTIYVIILVSFSDKLPCSCGGVLEQLSWQQHIIFNSAFTALAACGLWLHRQDQKANKLTSDIEIS